MQVRVASIDPTKETAVLAITPEPEAGLTYDGGHSAKSELEYDIVTDDGTKTAKIKAGFGMIGWVGALLFALPAIRNLLPGQPSNRNDRRFLDLLLGRDLRRGR
jgi:hypothetical protein